MKYNEIERLQQLAGIITEIKSVTESQFADKDGRLKPEYGKYSYDFGGEDNPVPNSTVVDIKKSSTNPTIIHDLNKVGNFPPKDFINLTFVLAEINNKKNLSQTINNSLKIGGILVVMENESLVKGFYKTYLKQNFELIEVYDFVGQLNENISYNESKFPIKINNKEELLSIVNQLEKQGWENLRGNGEIINIKWGVTDKFLDDVLEIPSYPIYINPIPNGITTKPSLFISKTSGEEYKDLPPIKHKVLDDYYPICYVLRKIK